MPWICHQHAGCLCQSNFFLAFISKWWELERQKSDESSVLIALRTSTEKEVAVSVRAGQQVKIPQFTEQDQRNRERKVNNLDMRAHCWLSPQAQPSNCTHLSTHVIMMRGKRERERKESEETSGCDKIVLNKASIYRWNGQRLHTFHFRFD